MFMPGGGEVPQKVIYAFEKQTGIQVNFSTFDSNETLYTKLLASKKQLYDLIEPSGYYVARLKKRGMLEKINTQLMPHYKNLDPFFKKTQFDPTGEYSIPYIWGSTAIFINKKYYPKTQVKSWKDLWQPLFKNQLLLLDDPRDVFSMALLSLSFNPNSSNKQQLAQAFQQLKKLMPNIKMFSTDTVPALLIDEDARIGIAWSGDVYHATLENSDIQYIYPKEGYVIWTDCFAIPKNAPHYQNAIKFLDFILRAKMGKITAVTENFAITNQASKKILPKKMRESKILYPSKKILARGYFQADISDLAMREIANYWELLKLQG